MAIERIIKIKSHRIFRGFVWPHDLLDFKGKSLFYSWNGTGKSTLSILFHSIEKRAHEQDLNHHQRLQSKSRQGSRIGRQDPHRSDER